MTDKLPPPVLLTEKQAKFVEGIGRGMLAKDAYRLSVKRKQIFYVFIDANSEPETGNL